MSKHDRLTARYWAIRDEHGVGYCMPILWHLAFRGDTNAMLQLSSTLEAPGPISDPFSGAGLAYRAFRAGNSLGAWHLAMDAFNRSDLKGYRYWLTQAASAGDADARAELRSFEIRLPHSDAARIGRKRPLRRGEIG